MPFVLKTFFPDLKVKEHTGISMFELPESGSQIWLGGLDDKERADKILGKEYSTVYFNECSQIPYGSVLIAQSRLAQVIPGLRQRAFYDLNPGPMGHWTNQLFGEHRDPVSRAAVDSNDYIRMFINPRDNERNLDPKYIESLERLPEKARKRFLEGIYQDETADALWSQRIIEDTRIAPSQLPPLVKIIVAIDPSGSESDLDDKHDAVGIVVAALGQDGHGYILNDATMHGSPEQWGSKAVAQYRFYKANGVVGEINYGGAMVEYVIRSIDKTVPFTSVTASRGKTVRAQPVAALYGQRMVHHVGYFPEMEDELCCAEGSIIATERGSVPIEEVVAGDYVWTRKGLRRVKTAVCTSVSAQVLHIETSCGSIDVTPRHPVYLQAVGYVRARDVRLQDQLTCLAEIPSMGMLNLRVIGIQKLGTDIIGGLGVGVCMLISGVKSIVLMLRQKEKSSIMQTLITGTTAQVILSVLRKKNIGDYTESTELLGCVNAAESSLSPTGRERISFVLLSAEARLQGSATILSGWMFGALDALGGILSLGLTAQKRALMSALGLLRRKKRNSEVGNASGAVGCLPGKRPLGLCITTAFPVGKKVTALLVPVFTAIKHFTTQMQEPRLVPAVVESISFIGERKRVYNLEVEDASEYFCNDHLVHNCSFTDFGYVGEKSPNRADALIWSLTELMLEESETGWVQYYTKQMKKGEPGKQIEKIESPTFQAPIIAPPATHVNLKTKPHAAFYAAGTDGTAKRVTADENGVIFIEVVYMNSLLSAGCERVS
jgi:hypothetical protein